jgi:hypothetical protein
MLFIRLAAEQGAEQDGEEGRHLDQAVAADQFLSDAAPAAGCRT